MLFKSIHAPAARGLSVAICQLAIAAAPLAAQAAEKPADKVKPADSKASGPARSELPILTRNELRACLARQDKLNTMQADVMKEQAELETEKAAIERQRVALKSELDGLDRTSAEAVEAYNAKSTEQDRRIEAYNQRGEPFNAKATDWQTQHATWDKDCASRRYDENDLTAIKAGR